MQAGREMLQGLARVATVAAGLAATGMAAAQAPLLTTEAELQGTAVPAAIETFWAERGQAATVTGQGGLNLALRRFLQPEIDAGLVEVLGTNDRPVVRIRNSGMFAFTAATLLAGRRAHSGSQSPWAASRSSTSAQIWSRSSSAAVCGSSMAA